MIPGAAGFIASAGGTSLKIWDLTSGRIVHQTSQHSKTITSMCLAHNCGVGSTVASDSDGNGSQRQTRLLTGGLDGQVKVYEMSMGALKCLHGHKMGGNNNTPVTALAMSQDGVRLIIGCSDGTFSVRQRPNPLLTLTLQQQSQLRLVEQGRAPMAGTYRHSMRVANANMDPHYDYAVKNILSASNAKTRKLNRFDKCLKQFRYADALDQALATKHPESVRIVVIIFDSIRSFFIFNFGICIFAIAGICCIGRTCKATRLGTSIIQPRRARTRTNYVVHAAIYYSAQICTAIDTSMQRFV